MSEHTHATAGAAAKPWVLVRAGESRLAIHSDWVRELLALPPITRLPGLPADALGLITWRGRAVPVIDLGARLGLRWVVQDQDGAADAGKRMAVVVALGGKPFALAVDAVDGVELLAPESRAPLPEGLGVTGASVREHARTRREGALVLLLDVAEVLGFARHDGADVMPSVEGEQADFWSAPSPLPSVPPTAAIETTAPETTPSALPPAAQPSVVDAAPAEPRPAVAGDQTPAVAAKRSRRPASVTDGTADPKPAGTQRRSPRARTRP